MKKKSYPYKGKKIILVWNDLQKIPAKKYGEKYFGEGKFIIVVSKKPSERKKHIGSKKTIIYDFS